MGSPAIDYDALAKQHGATPAAVDYDALAAQHGATPATPAEAPSLWDRAKANFNAATQGAQPGDGAVKGFVANVGQGGAQAVSAIAHPLDTLSSMAHAVAHPLDTAHAEVDALRSDPSKFIGNAIGQTAVGSVAGDVAGEGVSAVAPKVVPALGKAALLGKTPEAAYESALKPSTVLSPAQRSSMIQTGLENAVPVSKAGVEKLGDLIDTLNQKIKDKIAADPNRPIDPNAVATRADAAKARFANQVNAQPDLKAIEASKQQFLDEQGRTPAIPPKPTGILDAQGNPIMTAGTPAQPAPPMGAADAQAMKQGTYRVLKGKFGEQGSASVEAQKALARGLKEEIAKQFPEINNLNASESRLLDLQPVLERAVNRISNHQAIGIGTPIAGEAAAALTGSTSVGRVAMVLKGVLDNPNVKSRLAIAVSKAQKIPISTATSRVNAYASSLGATVAASQASSASDNSAQETTPPPSQ